MPPIPFVAYEEFGQRLRITALEPAAQWFLKQGAKSIIEKNPALAFYFENIDSTGIYLQEPFVKQIHPMKIPKHISMPVFRNLIGEDEKLRSALDLVIMLAPEEVEQQMDDLVCTPEQTRHYRKNTTCDQPPGIPAPAPDL